MVMIRAGRAGTVGGALLACAMLSVMGGIPASAATDDSFGVDTGPSPSCSRYGAAAYIDYGPEFGDDYVGVYDACKDGVGVKAWIWINGTKIGAQRNGSGFNTEVYVNIRNVTKKDSVGIEVCAQEGANGTPFACGLLAHPGADARLPVPRGPFRQA
jgi:hypothetical protein